MEIAVQRVYDYAPTEKTATATDYQSQQGIPVYLLVDRLWPRGVKKERLTGVVWEKELAPSSEARKEFAHKAENFERFRARYTAELDTSNEAVQIVERLRAERPSRVVLLYGAKDPQFNHAVVLKRWLERHLACTSAHTGVLNVGRQTTANAQAGHTHDELTLLGNQGTVYSADYDPSVLETFENQHADHDYMVTFRCPEFTTLCPITGQPDFATLYINYIPHIKMVESKSLKLYLFSFRNHGDFHEDVTNIIMNDLAQLMEPKYIEVRGMFYPRGGISIYPFANWANPEFDYGDVAARRMFEQLADLDRGDGAR